MGDLLRLRDLRVAFPVPGSENHLEVLAGVDLAIQPGESVALTGPSGCGKSLLAKAILGLLPSEARWSGDIIWRDGPLTDPGRSWAQVRGSEMALVLQEPHTSLNPVLTAGDQIAETLRAHWDLSRGEATRKAVDLLAEMKVPDPGLRAGYYPHQLSGGMRQRVLLAAALACDPALLIADEPTTALDVTIQKEILGLIVRVCRERGMSLLFITHDEDLVPLVATRQVRMSSGRIAGEEASPALDQSVVPVTAGNPVVGAAPVLIARGLVAGYRPAKQIQKEMENHGGRAPGAPVSGVDIDLYAGRALGLAGETGCGKTTLARVLSRHLAPAAGELELEGENFRTATGGRLRSMRRRVQMLFQDPAGSLNPRQNIGRALTEALQDDDPARGGNLLEEVGLSRDMEGRYPHELSGGQRQRVALARCLAADPAILIADEPTSALDNRSRDRVLSLLRETMERRGLALLIISHDFRVLNAVCGRVVVMFGGIVVESYRVDGGTPPTHPYTRELMAATPAMLAHDPGLWCEAGNGGPPYIESAVDGCPLAGRCPLQKSHCATGLPPLIEVAPGHFLRCPEAPKGDPSQFIDT